jgi:hypothetical protein
MKKMFSIFAVAALCSSAMAFPFKKVDVAEKLFESLLRPAVSVTFYTAEGGIVVGTSVERKLMGDLYCDKTATVVPEAKFNYVCHERVQMIDSSEEDYFNLIDAEVLDLRYGDVKTQPVRQQKSGKSATCFREQLRIGSDKYSYKCFSPINFQ